jgi:trans-aconitate methyltransferase
MGQPKTVLDIGCGNGHTIDYFYRRWKATQFTGLDLSGVAIKLAQGRYPYARFMVGSVGEVELPQFDLITLLGVAEHFEDLQGLLSECKKLLIGGGMMYIEVPNCLSYSESKVEGFRRLSFGSRQKEWHLSRQSWQQELEKAGLKVIASITGPTAYSEFVWILA